YDGAIATVTTEAVSGDDNAIAITVTSAGQLCAQGTARLPQAAATTPDLADFPIASLPGERPPASAAALPKGALLGTYEMPITADFAAQYLLDVRESLAIYADQGLVHPGVISRFGNRALAENVVLGPWIHVGSDIQNFATAKVGETLSVRAFVTDNYERKGHLFAELDAVVIAGGDRLIARIDHTAIYEPRQVRG
ncbi:MAG: hypothetical protein HOM07_17095, partial [Rhodospirillaceae bacterium]|nr:hypothetical protein [Rhodospirillaceae bacterium]